MSALTGLTGRAVVERNLRASRRFWLVLLSGFAEPLFYLFGIGVGLGQLVGEVDAGGVQVSYAAFVAPALLATSAMNGAVQEATNIFFKFRYAKTYQAMLSTPLEPADVVVGEILWSQLRGAVYALAFLAVVALLIGFAFAAVGVTAATYMHSYLDFDLVQLVILPLFLFSATFFPLDVYPPAVRPFVQLSPLYHGVALMRALTLGTADATTLAHVAYLAALGTAALLIARRRLARLLLA